MFSMLFRDVMVLPTIYMMQSQYLLNAYIAAGLKPIPVVKSATVRS